MEDWFVWHQLNPWGPNFNEIATTIFLSLVLSPFVAVGQLIHKQWRKSHPEQPEAWPTGQSCDRPWDKDRGWL